VKVGGPQILRLRPSAFAQDDTFFDCGCRRGWVFGFELGSNGPRRIAHLTLIELLDVDELIISEKVVYRDLATLPQTDSNCFHTAGSSVTLKNGSIFLCIMISVTPSTVTAVYAG
jgi:hypothetical protein